MKEVNVIIWGDGNNGIKVMSNSTNISSKYDMDRTYFGDYYGSNYLTFPYSAGNPHNWFMTQSLINGDDNYAYQVMCPSSQLGKCYERFGYTIDSGFTPWLLRVTNETESNTEFTGNHTQIGNMNITGDIL